MKDEYIIINKTQLLKKIDELKNVISKCILPEQQHLKDLFEQELEIKTQILSQSAPLIPEIEKAFGLGAANNANGKPLLSDYISNLKLDIQK